ncbi:MAG: hypothetical protein IKZ56_02870 [Bacteroidales bacterium]|nr:hypothetical protein [Bacteroidales bacterium]
MKHLSIKNITVLTLAAILMAACGKDNMNKDALIGQWVNTAQTFEITIAGQEYIPEGCICMEFTNDKVWILDSRTDCLPAWHSYTLSKESGKWLLEIQGGCYDGRVFIVEKLTNDELVLAPFSSGVDWDFRYIMKRDESSIWPN